MQLTSICLSVCPSLLGKNRRRDENGKVPWDVDGVVVGAGWGDCEGKGRFSAGSLFRARVGLLVVFRLMS